MESTPVAPADPADHMVRSCTLISANVSMMTAMNTFYTKIKHDQDILLSVLNIKGK